MKGSVAVIIPAYNEEITITKVVADFKVELPKADIYVINNNSMDKTAQLAKKAGARVMSFSMRSIILITTFTLL